MIELSRTQDEECGDGTTSVIILGKQFSTFVRTSSDPLHKQLEKFWRNRYPNWNATYILWSSYPLTTKL